ncbi:hypothetical protein [Halobacteriovorax sp. ZH2_bin.1]|uniref:hypothetical protein n=1 Tax=unclassified Halobacteriovorax TaxID=2639665 RepID=UPI003710CA02
MKELIKKIKSIDIEKIKEFIRSEYTLHEQGRVSEMTSYWRNYLCGGNHFSKDRMLWQTDEVLLGMYIDTIEQEDNLLVPASFKNVLDHVLKNKNVTSFYRDR